MNGSSYATTKPKCRQINKVIKEINLKINLGIKETNKQKEYWEGDGGSKLQIL